MTNSLAGRRLRAVDGKRVILRALRVMSAGGSSFSVCTLGYSAACRPVATHSARSSAQAKSSSVIDAVLQLTRCAVQLPGNIAATVIRPRRAAGWTHQFAGFGKALKEVKRG